MHGQGGGSGSVTGRRPSPWGWQDLDGTRSCFEQQFSRDGAAGEQGVRLAGLAEREPSGDPQAEPPGGHLIEDGAERAGSLVRAGQVVAGGGPVQGQGACAAAGAGEAGQPGSNGPAGPLDWPESTSVPRVASRSR